MPLPTENSSARSFRIDTDHHLQEMMRTAISRLQSGDIEVRLTEKLVVMHGVVRSWTEKQSVQECVRSISTSRTIQNDVTVATPLMDDTRC